MAQHSITVTMLVRNDTAANWISVNPTPNKGELCAEIDTRLLKIGDGVTPYTELSYLNKINNADNITIKVNNNDELTIGDYGSSYWEYDPTNDRYNQIMVSVLRPMPTNLEALIYNGQLIWAIPYITNHNFNELQNTVNGKLNISGGSMTGALILANDPYNNMEAATKHYVDSAIAAQGALTRQIVNSLPPLAEAKENVIYMILDSSVKFGDKYKEYMLIGGVLTQIGDTSVDLSNYIEKIQYPTVGNLVAMGPNGTLINSGKPASEVGNLRIATASELGGVLSYFSPSGTKASDSKHVDPVWVNPYNGTMALTQVSTSKLYVPADDEFVINGGTST